MILKKCFVLIILCLLCPAVFGQTDFLSDELSSGKENELAPSATFTVTKTADTNDGVCDSDCSLREAITAANAAATDDVINFDATVFATAQTITLTLGELTIANNGLLTINGTGANLLTISGNNAARVFNIAAGANSTINGVTISGGNLGPSVGGAGILNDGTLNLTSSTVSGNSVGLGNGAGINSTGTLNLTSSTVSGNSAGFSGGGIWSSGVLNLINSTISGNSGPTGGGGIFNSGGTVNITNGTISGNSTTNAGGGIANIVGPLRARNTIISGNTAPSQPDLSGVLAVNENNLIGGNAGLQPLGNYGGTTQTRSLSSGSPAINAGNNCVATQSCAIFNAPLAVMTDQRGRLRDASVDIGAFEFTSLSVTKTADTNDGVCDADCSLREAIAAAQTGDTILFASSVFNTPQTITLTLGELSVGGKTITISGTGANNLSVSGNNTFRVFNVLNNTNLTLNGITVTGGRAPIVGTSTFGGGINLASNATVNLINCAVTGNTASGASSANSGGGIFINIAGTLNLINSTVSGNSVSGSALSRAGGIYLGNGTVNITNSTVSGNTANISGGIFNNFGTVRIRNTIVSGNTAPTDADLSGTLSTNENNIIGDFANVRLAPLGFYGGTTQTHALLSGSTAINAGNNCVLTQSCAAFNAPIALTADQRGAARVGNVDIGAFEANSSANGGTFRATLPDGRLNSPYSFVLVPSNGTTSYAVTGGALPPGMNLTTALAPSAVVSLTGTPTTGGVFNFTVTATNGANTSVTNYSVNIVVPTAAGVSVSGRVLTSDGRGVTNAVVVITDSSGNARSVRTGTFGYFRFDSVSAGQTHIVTVNSKRFIFPPRVVEISDELTNLNFIADGRD